MARNPFRDVRKAKPTKAHRPAIWECMLGTVYARSPEGEVRYFDYDWEAAKEFAGVNEDADPRLARHTERVSYSGDYTKDPRRGQMVLWVK